MNLPTSIKVGYRDILIQEVLEAIDVDGDYDAFHGVIRIRADAPIQYKAELLLHELGHAEWDMAGLGEAAVEETAVSALAKLRAQVHRDNPQLRAFLDAALSSELEAYRWRPAQTDFETFPPIQPGPKWVLTAGHKWEYRD